MVPILARNGFDSSAFVDAGAMSVDTDRMVSPIVVLKRGHFDGGLFHRGLALSPLRVRPEALGIQFDNPLWQTW